LRALKFGVCLASWNEASAFYAGLDYGLIKPYAMLCEELGYDTLWAPDHFVLGDAMYECWTLLAAIAAATQKIRIGPLLLCYSHRNPSLVAKMAATLDVISGGRLNFGLGAGWHKDEHLAYGFGWSDEPARRIRGMIEAIEIVKALWTQEEVTYKGTVFSTNEAVCNPKPVQKPHQPVWIGGGGEKLLRAVASYADAWNVPALPAEEYARKLKVLKTHCERNGRQFEKIEKSMETRIMVTNDQWELERIKKWLISFSSYNIHAPPPTDILDKYIVGNSDACCRRIEEYQRAGVQHLTLYPLDFPSTRTVKTLSKDIMPLFR